MGSGLLVYPAAMFTVMTLQNERLFFNRKLAVRIVF